MTNLHDVLDVARREQFLAVVSTLRSDNTIQSSIVNAGVLAHPIDGGDVVGFVTYGRAKLANHLSKSTRDQARWQMIFPFRESRCAQGVKGLIAFRSDCHAIHD